MSSCLMGRVVSWVKFILGRVVTWVEMTSPLDHRACLITIGWRESYVAAVSAILTRNYRLMKFLSWVINN